METATRYGMPKTDLAGQGVDLTGIAQIRDPFLDKRFREEYGQRRQVSKPKKVGRINRSHSCQTIGAPVGEPSNFRIKKAALPVVRPLPVAPNTTATRYGMPKTDLAGQGVDLTGILSMEISRSPNWASSSSSRFRSSSSSLGA